MRLAQFPNRIVVAMILLAACGIDAQAGPGGWMPGLRGDHMIDTALAPAIDTCIQSQPVLKGGVELTLIGENFREGCRAHVGDREIEEVNRVSSEKLTFTLPDLPGPTVHSLTIVNPDGLEGELEGGIPYGRLLKTIRPREVLPKGGDVVTLTGAGFEEDTVFLFGAAKGEIMELNATRARIRVPPAEAGPVTVSARTGEAEFGNPLPLGYAPHPYLYFRDAELSALREKFGKPMFRPYRQRILDKAESLLAEDPKGGLGTAHLAITYALTEDERYRDKALEGIRRTWGERRAGEFAMMGVAGMAVGYDILFAELSPAERIKFREYLERMLTSYLQQAYGSWFIAGGGGNFSNTVPVGNSGGMLAALAMMHSSARAEKAIAAATKNAKHYLDNCISPDGGCREGIQYWDFGLGFHLLLAQALENATGDDRGLLDHPHLKKSVNFVRTQLGGHGGLFAFNDTREPFLDGYAIYAALGSRYNQPLMLWLADATARGIGKTRARDVWPAYAFLWRSEQPAPEKFPGVPTLAWLKDMHWGAMRSDSAFMPDLVVGVKGSRGPLTHHKQNDLGSYVLHANGEAYLVDPGYYEGKATDHTLPLIDDKGPGVSGSSIVEAWEKGPWRYMVLDSTDGYGRIAKRVRRLIVMVENDTVVVLDDIVPANPLAQITAQYQTGWPPTVAEGKSSMSVEGRNGTLHLQCFGHPVVLNAQDRTFSHGWHWKKISKTGPGDWHSVSAVYPAAPDRPLVTVLQTAPAGKPKPPPPQCRYEDGRVEVQIKSRPPVRFQQKPDGWHFMKNTAGQNENQ